VEKQAANSSDTIANTLRKPLKNNIGGASRCFG
jgi:hypothetical protein